jgi:hypothetical protein
MNLAQKHFLKAIHFSPKQFSFTAYIGFFNPKNASIEPKLN